MKALPDEPCRDNLCVIYHKTVAGIQVVDDIIEMPVLGLSGIPVHNHQPRTGSVRKRILRNQFLRKIIVKIACFHDAL